MPTLNKTTYSFNRGSAKGRKLHAHSIVFFIQQVYRRRYENCCS